LFVTAIIVPSGPILYTLMMEEIISSETSVLMKATRRHIQEYGILHIYRLQNLKSYAALNSWAL
jgi:hypothetical protein